MSELNPKSFKTFGELLRHLRQRARLTQDDLGAAVGYWRAHIARLEGNQRTPDAGAVKARFLDALNLQASSEAAVRLIELALVRHDGDQGQTTESEPVAGTKQIPNNLPFQITSFVGREQILAELAGLLPSTRLLTLTGTGGTGKTRLALQLADAQLQTYPNGIWLVELAPRNCSRENLR